MEEEEPERVRQISLDEAKNIDTNQVAYFTLTDGTVVVVKPDVDENKENMEDQKDVEDQQNQEEEQQEIVKSKNENELNNIEDINTDIQQTKTEEKNENIENENAENAENQENAENVENVENQENEENVENQENTENQENVENAENQEMEQYEENVEQYENENPEYIVQNDNGVMVENYENYIENYQEPKQVEYIESKVDGGGKMMSYGGIIEERNNYRFYASGIGYIEPEENEQQLIEEQQNLLEQNQENEELLQQQQIENDENYYEEQPLLCCRCGQPCENIQMCDYCKNLSSQNKYYSNYKNENYYNNYNTRVGNMQGVMRQDGQLFKVIEAVPVKLNEYEDIEYIDSNNQKYYPQNVEYVEEEYVPEGYVIEDVNDNYYEDDKDNCCTCGDDQYEGEYYVCEESPRCNCPMGQYDDREVRVVRNVRRVPLYKNNYNYYETYGFSNNARVRGQRAGRK